jgi:N-acetylneuraminic acid mutarotase
MAREWHLNWTTSKPMPEPRSDYAAGVLDGKLIIAGGTYWDGTKGHWIKKHFTASTHAFDPASGTWTQLPDLPVPLGGAASATVEKQLFVFGGYNGSTVNRDIFSLRRVGGRYEWRRLGSMNVDRVFAVAIAVRRKIYIVGGATKFEPYDEAGTCCTTRSETNTLFVFDTEAPNGSSAWRELRPSPGIGRLASAAVADGRVIWLFGGLSQANSTDPIAQSETVFRYDIAGDEWTSEGSLPPALAQLQPLSPIRVEQEVLLLTGQRRIWRFTPETRIYEETTAMPVAVAVDRFFLIGNRIVGAGGEDEIEGPRRRSPITFEAEILRVNTPNSTN